MELINTLLYFAVFKYPLTEKELKRFCQYKTGEIDEELKRLLATKQVYKVKNYYLPSNNLNWVTRREKGNEMAENTWAKASKMSNLLSQFPFVRSVMVSGTLSKGYMDKQADIDFFVIMKPGNIVISKSLMGLYRRLLAPKSLCVNFLIDTNNLYIKKQNLYSATEMMTLVPMVDDNLYYKFMDINSDWVEAHLPNAELLENNMKAMKNGRLKVFLESVLSTKLAGNLNQFLQKFYLNKLGKRKEKYVSSLKTGELLIKEGVFKGHNLSYQKTIIDSYNNNLNTFVQKEDWKPKHFFYD